MEALRVLREGWIGPYSDSAIGQPTGPAYLVAAVFAIAGASSTALHVAISMFGIAAVPATYLLARLHFGRSTAIIAATMMAVSYWQVFYSRSGFMVASFPLATALAAAGVLTALRSERPWVWPLGGGLVGLGIYSYNAYLGFVVVVLAFIGLVALIARDRLLLPRLVLMAVGAIIAAYPMIQFAQTNTFTYLQHPRFAAITNDLEFQQSSMGEKVRQLAGRLRTALLLPLTYSKVDYGDGFGYRGALDGVTALFAYAGLVVAVRRWRSPPHLLAALAFVLGLCAIVPFTDGEMRLILGVGPFAFVLAALALDAVARQLGPARRHALVGVVGVIVVMNVTIYFTDIVEQDNLPWIYASDLVAALDTSHAEDPGLVYFYSPRWEFDYATRQFLYPDTEGVDRSREHGTFGTEKTVEGTATYVLFPPYTDEIAAIRRALPNGVETTELLPDGSPRFTIYRVE